MYNRKPYLYLAGKIRRNDWRLSLVPQLGTTLLGQPIECENFHYDGPYLMSCDHGCAHGPETHGLGYGGCIWLAPPKWLVPGLCYYWLKRANLVFAWIDDPTCFGTLTEIGWAQALDRPVFIGFSTYTLQREMWFAAAGPSTCAGQFDSPHDALQQAISLASRCIAI